MEDTIPISRSGWCLLRAWSEKAEHPILDMYPYATTSPIYVTVAGSNPKAAEDAAYFIAWIDRLTEDAKSNQDWNTDAEKNAVLEMLTRRAKIYVQIRSKLMFRKSPPYPLSTTEETRNGGDPFTVAPLPASSSNRASLRSTPQR